MREIHSLKEWKAALKNHDRVMIDVYGVNCPPCKEIAPEIEKLAKKLEKQVYIYKCDVDQPSLDALLRGYEVNSMPTFLFFCHGQFLKKLTVHGANLTSVCLSIDKLLYE